MKDIKNILTNTIKNSIMKGIDKINNSGHLFTIYINFVTLEVRKEGRKNALTISYKNLIN